MVHMLQRTLRAAVTKLALSHMTSASAAVCGLSPRQSTPGSIYGRDAFAPMTGFEWFREVWGATTWLKPGLTLPTVGSRHNVQFPIPKMDAPHQFDSCGVLVPAGEEVVFVAWYRVSHCWHLCSYLDSRGGPGNDQYSGAAVRRFSVRKGGTRREHR